MRFEAMPTITDSQILDTCPCALHASIGFRELPVPDLGWHGGELLGKPSVLRNDVVPVGWQFMPPGIAGCQGPALVRITLAVGYNQVANRAQSVLAKWLTLTYSCWGSWHPR